MSRAHWSLRVGARDVTNLLCLFFPTSRIGTELVSRSSAELQATCHVLLKAIGRKPLEIEWVMSETVWCTTISTIQSLKIGSTQT